MLIIGERYKKKLAHGLRRTGQTVLWLPDNPDLDPRLAGHVDLSVFMPISGTLIAAEGICGVLVKELTNTPTNTRNRKSPAEYTLIQADRLGETYPRDAGLCICWTGKFTICDPDTISEAARDHLCGAIIPVNQGYTKCSVCVVSENSIITSDDLIAARAADAGMDVLQIEPGHIELNGFEYGFIGGASFLIENKTIAFTGSLDQHPDKSAILSFLSKHNVEPVFLTDSMIFDIGGAIWLK